MYYNGDSQFGSVVYSAKSGLTELNVLKNMRTHFIHIFTF